MAFGRLACARLTWILPAALCLCCLRQAWASDPNAVLRRMASQPFRYGGELSGGISGHMLLAFARPAPDGRVHGEAMMLTSGRHLIGVGTVTGAWQARLVPGGHACALTITLPTYTLKADAICSAETLSGDFTNKPISGDWLAQQIFWWPSERLGSQSWMTKAAFYD